MKILLKSCQIFSFLLFAICKVDASNSDFCYGLALSDGKAMGPYQAGVMSALI